MVPGIDVPGGFFLSTAHAKGGVQQAAGISPDSSL
jgi:hypothetical protein